jgi:hypothetical protein
MTKVVELVGKKRKKILLALLSVKFSDELYI